MRDLPSHQVSPPEKVESISAKATIISVYLTLLGFVLWALCTNPNGPLLPLDLRIQPDTWILLLKILASFIFIGAIIHVVIFWRLQSNGWTSSKSAINEFFLAQSSYLEDAQAHVEALQSLHGTRLISWDKSADYELAAQHVICITATLHWVSIFIADYIEDVKKNADHRYLYIVYDDGDSTNDQRAKSRITTLRRKIADSGVQDKIAILDLKDISAGLATSLLPVVGDIVVYQNIARVQGKGSTKANRTTESRRGQTVVVISTRHVRETEDVDGDKCFDLVIDEKARCQSILKWIYDIVSKSNGLFAESRFELPYVASTYRDEAP